MAQNLGKAMAQKPWHKNHGTNLKKTHDTKNEEFHFAKIIRTIKQKKIITVYN